MKKLTSVVSAFLMLLLTFFTLSPLALALSENEGSITIDISDSKSENFNENVSFRLYFIAKANKSSDGIRYEMVSPYDESNIDIGDLQDSGLPVHLAFFAEYNSLSFKEKVTDQNGVVVFNNLSQGLYLVVPSGTVSSPFLVSVPIYDSVKGKWKYDVEASPKFTEDEEIEDGETYLTVVKEWHGRKDHPESITVVLLRDFEEYDRVTLSDANSWHYRWDNLSKNHIWNAVEADVPDGFLVYYEESSNTVTIINKSEDTSADDITTEPSETEPEKDKLVQTGQLNWPVPVCVIAGLLIFAAGWMVLNTDRKESE